MERHLKTIHKWMNEPHVIPFWQLNGPVPKFEKHLEKALADRHQTLYMGLVDGFPMSYWESYWTIDDVVGKHYTPHHADQGVHLLIGETDFLGKGYSSVLLQAMTDFQFQHPQTEKIISEPDIRNDKMIHVFQKCGFEPQKEIELEDKRALLMFCYRSNFERIWSK